MTLAGGKPEFDPLIDQQPARFVVGIDLGTTNSAVAYVDTDASSWQVHTLAVTQLVDAGVIERRETLPSFHYEAMSGQASDGSWRLPWQREDPSYTVGILAREQGRKNPSRLIASAKSWLCHRGVDRTAPLLPWHGAADVQRLSPVEVSARILAHVRDAWNSLFPNNPLDQQDIVLTLPASFDEVARELTVQAAAQAGLSRVVLLEEPQAAFYAWVYKYRKDWMTRVRPGQTILVCDIGGGTTDFTLIRVRADAPTTEAGSISRNHEQIQFHRVAVGNHLILGGDNLDLTLARDLESRLTDGGKLPPAQWDVLVRASQRVKEQMLGGDGPDRLTVHLPGSGSRLMGGAIQAGVEREQVQRLLLDGFLPSVALTAPLQAHRSGFQEFGLPYAADPAITRHLAAFLRAHRDVVHDDAHDNADTESTDEAVRPDVVLLNGGFFASPVLRQRLIDILGSWFQDHRRGQASPTEWTPTVLENERLELAVARGAAYYGMVRRGKGVRITANLARTYYVRVEGGGQKAVCLIPGDARPGQDIELPNRTFQLLISEPVEFPLLVSSTRLTDRPGQLFEIDDEQMISLPPIRTVLRARSRRDTGRISVRLHARLTEIGTIELWCSDIGQQRSWRLQFDVRSATQTDIEAHQSAAESEGVLD